MIAHCPGCRPGPTDPLSEFTDRCGEHRLEIAGTADHLVDGPLWQPYMTSEGEADVNRAMCALLHRADPAAPS